jgi:hypothetical protein
MKLFFTPFVHKKLQFSLFDELNNLNFELYKKVLTFIIQSKYQN